jgi:hypothetical protein
VVRQQQCSLFVWLISHQPAVLFSQNKSAISNQPTVLFSQNKPAPAISHQPTEQAALLLVYELFSQGSLDSSDDTVKFLCWDDRFVNFEN